MAGTLNRTLIQLALASGIPPAVWAKEGERAIATALDILEQQKPPGTPH